MIPASCRGSRVTRSLPIHGCQGIYASTNHSYHSITPQQSTHLTDDHYNNHSITPQRPTHITDNNHITNDPT